MADNQDHILLADDHGIIRLIVKIIIQKYLPDATFHEAGDFVKVQELINKFEFSLIVLDINMPGGDYFQTLELIGQKQSDAKILVFSSYDESLYSIRSLEAGADSYVQKTSSTEDFNKAVKKILKVGQYASNNISQQKYLKNKLDELDKKKV